MWTGLALGLALLSSVLLYISRYDTPLPYPWHHHHVVDVDPALLPTDASPLEGVYAPNELLRKAHRLFDGVIHASESVCISPGGNLTLLDKYGYLYEAEPAEGAPGAVFPDEWVLDLPAAAYVGPGRPLGFHYDAAGNLIIADSTKGLLMLEAGSRRLVVLSNRVSPDAELLPGSPLTYVNDLDIAHLPDSPAGQGAIYFSASQDIPVSLSDTSPPYYDTFRSYMLGLFSGAFKGRLLRYTPSTGRTEVLVHGIWYANGVALAPDESYVAVVETNRLRVLRHWLAGPRAGTTDVLIDRLPGFPDGISRAPDGNLWVALVAPITPLTALLKHRALRAVLAYLPAWARPKVPSWGAALKISPAGRPLQLLMDPNGTHVAFVSSVLETPGPHPRLYFGNVRQNYVSYMDAKDVPPLPAE